MPPFKSAKQRRYLFATHPEVAKRLAKDSPKRKKPSKAKPKKMKQAKRKINKKY